MWTTIIRQTWNERKGNILIWLELVIVSAFMWYTVDALYIAYKSFIRPVGFDISHTYYLSFGEIGKESDEYDPTAAEAATPADYFYTIYDRISQNPHVEAICYTGGNHFHYKWSNQFNNFKNDSLMRFGYTRDVSPSYFRVFNVQSADGRNPEELANALKRDEIVITATVANTFFGNAPNALNKEIRCIIQGEDSAMMRIGAVCEPQRYNEFNEYDYAFYRQLSAEDMNYGPVYTNIFIRVKPNSDAKTFADNFRKEMREQLRIGNYFLSGITPMYEYREPHLRRYIDQVRMNVATVGFFLLNVLLGVVGTFWLRTQRKQSEIGLRIAIGSTRPDIAKLLFLEANTLLLAAFIPATLIFINLQYAGVIEQADWLPLIPRFLAGMIITYLLLALMIGIGISFPARRAIKVKPAEVLHEE